MIEGFAGNCLPAWMADKADSDQPGNIVYIATEMGVRPAWALGFIVSFLSFLGFLAAVMWLVMVGSGR